MQVGMYKSALFGPQNTKKSLPKFSIGDRTILNKKVHANPKFKNVTPKTDTGFNSRKREELQKEISKYYKVNIYSSSYWIFVIITCHFMIIDLYFVVTCMII